MTDSTLSAIYKGWETYQGFLIDALKPLSNEQLQLRPGPDLWTVSRIARHIIAARVFWYHDVAGIGDAALYKPMQTWDDFEVPERNAAEIIGGLQSSWALMQEAITAWTQADLDTPISRQRSNGESRTVSRQWIIWHIIEHDLSHGGEISMILGAHGLKGMDL